VGPTHTDNAPALELLADFASSFAVRDADRVRAVRDRGGMVDRDMWRRIGEAGWPSILVPENLDGAGLGVDAAVIVSRRLGRGGFPEPFVAGGVLAPMVLAAAQDAGESDRLGTTLAGTMLVGVAWSPGVTASDDGRLSGESRFVGLAGADGYVVASAHADGVALHWLGANAPGLSASEERLADGTLSARLILDQARGEELVPAPHGGAVLARALDMARIVLAGELVGIADAALELTLDYLRQRKQFGRPIGSFQVLQHRAVDMWMARQLAAAALEFAVRVATDPETTPQQLAVAASSAKARSAQTATSVCGSALQLHGAIGFTDEYDLGIYLNRALALAPWLGSAVESRRRWLSHLDEDGGR
jgi:3-oxochol-4-en-24-oyl-CoA dehydrogenase